ncbi:curli production assembly/transport protein CsgE [Kaistella anthropi]|nr:curli production assembly/transport protein CsgE [Kaistella anthropi]
MNLQKNDALKVFLFIKDEQTGQLISKDSLEINAKTFTRKVSNVNENEIFELKGLTIDQTKTKTGKDFYDLFTLNTANYLKK